MKRKIESRFVSSEERAEERRGRRRKEKKRTEHISERRAAKYTFSDIEAEIDRRIGLELHQEYVQEREKQTALEDELWLQELDAETKRLAREQIEYIKTMYPEAFYMDQELWKVGWSELVTREDFVRNIDMKVFLELYGLRHIEFEVSERGVVKIDVLDHFHNRRLAEGYAYKGGAARSLLLRSLGLELRSVPRDIDLIRIKGEKGVTQEDRRLAKIYMPDDAQDGYGVEFVGDIDAYFASRDYTINEVYATDSAIYCTEACVRDTIRRIIRVTQFERDRFEGQIGSKMLAKAMRFYAEGIERYQLVELAEKENMTIESTFVSPFWLAVQLDRAVERGDKAVKIFIAVLKDRKQIPEKIQTDLDLASYLQSIMSGGYFHFRNIELRQAELEMAYLENHEDEEFDDYELLPKHGSHRRKIE